MFKAEKTGKLSDMQEVTRYQSGFARAPGQVITDFFMHKP